MAAPSSSCCQAADDLVEPVADLLVAARRDHVGEAAAGRHLDQRTAPAGVVVGDLFDEQQDLHVVLVLAGVHIAAQGITGGHQQVFKAGEGKFGSRHGGMVSIGPGGKAPKTNGTRRCRFMHQISPMRRKYLRT